MDKEGVPHLGQGFTRDISVKGMFICSDSLPPVKVDIHVELSFGSVAEAFTDLRMSAEALVIRLEWATRPEIPRGFAILNRSCKLHNGAPIEG